MWDTGRTRVYLTVDVECAEERVKGGAVQPPLGYDLRVWGRLANQREPLGLPLITGELARAGLQATFFVEPLGARYFGEHELAEACRFLRAAGQDVQLHLHPVQRRIDWHTRGDDPPSDDMADYSVEEQRALLDDGLSLLVRAGVPRASLVGFRAGNFGANNDTWRALAASGLHVSSNFNLCYRDKNCAIRWPSRENALFDTGVGVWELPVSNFVDGNGRFRHLQVTATSFPEMRHFLVEARRMGLPEVTIVTHSFEYFLIDSIEKRQGRPNSFNIERLRRLCAFLRENEQDFMVDTVGALGRRLCVEGGVSRPANDVVPAGRPELRLGRVAEQLCKRLMVLLPV